MTINEKIKKLFLISCSIAILFTGFSIFYYYVSYLPKEKLRQQQEKSRQQLLENNIKCNQVGYSLYEKQKAEDPYVRYGPPEFKFNEKLNTCLYKYFYFSGDYLDERIMDVYTNVDMVFWTEKVKGMRETIVGSQEEWERKSKELFGY